MKTIERFHVRDGRVVKMRYVWHDFTPWSTLYPDCVGADFEREWQVFEEYLDDKYGREGERFIGRRDDPKPPSQGYSTLAEALDASAGFWCARLERARTSMQEATENLTKVRQQIESMKAKDAP